MGTRGNGQEQHRDSGVPSNRCDRPIHGVGLRQTAIRRRRALKFAEVSNSTLDAELRSDRFSGPITKFCIARIGEQGFTSGSMPLIVIPDDAPPVLSRSDAVTQLRDCEHRIYPTLPANSEELVARIADADAVINIRSSTRFSADVLAACPQLRLISIWGTGTDHVDLVAAKALGLGVTNTPSVSAVAVAEHTVSLMFAVARQTVNIDRAVRTGEWPRAMVQQLHGKTLGVIGTGAIGREVARLGAGIGMNVIAWSFNQDGDYAWVMLEDLFRRADVISVHVRQSPETLGMIRAEHFAMMRPTAIFINTARGRIVVEKDLVDALRSGRIAGAGLDVFETEPLPADSPLRLLPNVVLTPHAAGITHEATEAGLAMAIANVLAFRAGAPVHVVN
jgi:phosphoglycerate dehydrogenase-like enzyme